MTSTTVIPILLPLKIWKNISGNGRIPKDAALTFICSGPTAPYKEDQSILVAGCGTSQAAKHALRWPAAQVTGIDCSATSVRRTEQLKRKYNLKNLEVRQLRSSRQPIWG